MKEHEVREAVAKLWRNHPNGVTTYHHCKSEGCTNPARDDLCDTCIIATYKGERRFLNEVLYAIKKYNEAVSDLVDAEHEAEEMKQ